MHFKSHVILEHIAISLLCLQFLLSFKRLDFIIHFSNLIILSSKHSSRAEVAKKVGEGLVLSPADEIISDL